MKRLAAIILSVLCLWSFAGCAQGQGKTESVSAESASESSAVSAESSSEVSEEASSEVSSETSSESGEAAADYLSGISGTYVELFPELSKAEYRDIWIEDVTPIVGAENAESTTDMLLNMCMAEPYGAEAAEKYAADPDSMAFNCYFLGGVQKFVMDGDTITGLDENGQEVFSHTYKLLDVENENGFIFYQSEDENAGEFTYFAFSPDTMETTYHLEFRYAENLDDLQSWFEGNYAYWNAAAIAEDYDLETMQNVIELFAAENLSE